MGFGQLLSSIFGGGDTSYDGIPSPGPSGMMPVTGADGFVSMQRPGQPVQPPMQAPMAEGGPADPGQYYPQDPPANGGEQLSVIADRWKPHKPTILGAIADAYLMSKGMKPMFSQQRKSENMENAMKGFTDDPMRSIRRVGQFDPDSAWKMYNETVDNQRQKGSLDRQNQLFDFQKQKYVYGQLAGMMGVAAKRNDPSTWSTMREQALKYGQTFGIDASNIIPEQFDPNAIETIALGSVPVGKQMQLDETHRYHDDTTQYRRDSLEERRNYHGQQVQLGARRAATGEGNLSERQEHNDVTEQQGADRLDKTPAKPSVRAYDTKYGRGMVNKEGTQMNIIPDPRVDQSKLHKTKNGYRLIYDNLGTPDKPIWRLRKP